jgi:signal transduction histidine kinase/ActR/RegA family two-component response regulator
LNSSRIKQLFGDDERVRQVRVATAIGGIVGLLFSVFNLATAGMLALGLAELSAVLFLVIPAFFLSARSRWLDVSESMLLLAAFVIFGALIVFGGVEDTGLFWVYTAPFLAFFLKGQRVGWWCSVGFVVLAAVYLLGVGRVIPIAHHYSPVVTLHFLLSLCFYTLVATAFNLVRTHYEAQLKDAKQFAEAAYLAKSRFLAAASHDLRQPAHALGMFVARLVQQPNPPPTQELVAGVDASVRALQEMLDVFFDYSRLESQSTEIRARAVPLESLFAQLQVVFASAAQEKGLRLRIRPTRAWVHTDPVLLLRILLNLVGNAVQYTERGSILVACRPSAVPGQVRIEVWDSGIGIAEQHHDRIFEEFFQVENPERDRSKGLGLGLSMVDRSCRLLQHRLTVRSELGRGSRFGLRIPLADALVAAPARRISELSLANDLQGLQVLVIEDDTLSSVALTGLLESWGCGVTVASDALGACALLQTGHRPDLVLSDYRLRGNHNGIEAIATVRAVARRPIPACLISGDTDVDVAYRARAAKLALLRKPVQPAKLRSLIRRLKVEVSEPPELPTQPQAPDTGSAAR